MTKFHLIGNEASPWVQRVVIILRAKQLEFDITYFDLKDRPDWF